MESFILVLITVYISYLFYEKKLNDRRRRTLKYLIHVNGIRGKSTVSRLIDAGIRAGNYKVFTKITGTAPRVIDCEGKELEILRRGKANIKEQIKALKWAVDEGAEVVILECMAVKPELQYICENSILKADICVITNVREDHLDEMGGSLDSIAKSLGNTMPKGKKMFTSDKKYFEFFKKLGKEIGTEVYLADREKEEYNEINFPSNVALALEVCKAVGIKKEIALEGMKNYYKDPGSLKTLHYVNKKGKNIYFTNAMAANDPNSTEFIINEIEKKSYWNNRRYLLVNNRKDRVSRWEQYIRFVKKMEDKFDKIVVSGENKNLFTHYLEKVKVKNIEILERKEYFDEIGENTLVIAVGNICGHGKELLDYLEEKGEIIDGK